MASPIVVGTTAIVAVPANASRNNIRFQNTSSTQTIYLKRIPTTGAYGIVSTTDYDIRLLPDTATAEGGEPFETQSTASFMVISSASAGSLAIFETVKV